MPPEAGVRHYDQLRVPLVQGIDQPSERHQLGLLRAKLVLDSTCTDRKTNRLDDVARMIGCH